jgi:uncharacterized repeat protein (TIGR03803 family)
MIHMKREKVWFPTKWPVMFFIVILILAGSVSAVGQSESVLYSFKGSSDGSFPAGALVSDKSGSLYGATGTGGAGARWGTIFRLTMRNGHWTHTVLYRFKGGTDGAGPVGGLIFDQAGNLYGTTTYGGSGWGTVFKLSPRSGEWTETVIYSFQGGTNGALPYAGLVFDGAGSLYGTTRSGGPAGLGTVFELTRRGNAWTEKVILTLWGSDGYFPEAGLIVDKARNLFGTAQYGGSFGGGTVFKLKPPTTRGGQWAETVLYNFTSGSDGGVPRASVMFDQKGNLDGTTAGGGFLSAGTVFQLASEHRGPWPEAVLYSFTGGDDGLLPTSSLISDKAGNLYGTTMWGGSGGSCQGVTCGTVFQLTPPADQGGIWIETVFHNFTNDGHDGNWPQSGLIRGKDGTLYGTTAYGGSGACKSGTDVIGCGTVFEIHP